MNVSVLVFQNNIKPNGLYSPNYGKHIGLW